MAIHRCWGLEHAQQIIADRLSSHVVTCLVNSPRLPIHGACCWPRWAVLSRYSRVGDCNGAFTCLYPGHLGSVGEVWRLKHIGLCFCRQVKSLNTSLRVYSVDREK